MPKEATPIRTLTARKIARGEGNNLSFQSMTQHRVGGDRRIIIYQNDYPHWDGPVLFGVVSGQAELDAALAKRGKLPRYIDD